MVTATEHSYKDLELINPGLSHDCLVITKCTKFSVAREGSRKNAPHIIAPTENYPLDNCPVGKLPSRKLPSLPLPREIVPMKIFCELFLISSFYFYKKFRP